MQSTAVNQNKDRLISIPYCRRTFFRQSGALENIWQRETKIGLAATQVVRRFSERSPQILGILGAQLSDRELCPRPKWRRRRCWQLTVSACNLLILLAPTIHKVRFPHGAPVVQFGLYAVRRWKNQLLRSVSPILSKRAWASPATWLWRKKWSPGKRKYSTSPVVQ